MVEAKVWLQALVGVVLKVVAREGFNSRHPEPVTIMERMLLLAHKIFNGVVATATAAHPHATLRATGDLKVEVKVVIKAYRSSSHQWAALDRLKIPMPMYFSLAIDLVDRWAVNPLDQSGNFNSLANNRSSFNSLKVK